MLLSLSPKQPDANPEFAVQTTEASTRDDTLL
jgi:hypothetical protein